MELRPRVEPWVVHCGNSQGSDDSSTFLPLLYMHLKNPLPALAATLTLSKEYLWQTQWSVNQIPLLGRKLYYLICWEYCQKIPLIVNPLWRLSQLKTPASPDIIHLCRVHPQSMTNQWSSSRMCVGSPILGQCWKSTPTFQLQSSPGDVLQASLKRSQSHFSPCLAVLLCFSLLQGLTLRAVSNQHQLHNFPLTVSLMNVNCNNNCGSFAAFLRLVLPNAPLR